MARKSAAFPVGLYGVLLFALTWLTLPRVFAPLERVVLGASTLVPRLVATWFGEPVQAADRDGLRQVDALCEQLQARVERHDFAGAGIVMPAGHEPILCSVLTTARLGGGAEVSELLLDHSYRELGGVERVVTKGGALLGVLARPGRPEASEDQPSDPARVILCNHRMAPRLLGALVLEQGRGELNLVVKPGTVADPVPLVVDLWDDPYVAARLRTPMARVLTRSTRIEGTRAVEHAEVPGGLLLGRTRIWGYPDRDGARSLPIGVYVEPAFDYQALSHAVLWRPPQARSGGEAAAAGAPLPRLRRCRGVVRDLPGTRHGRQLLAVDVALEDGAAVVQDGWFLGTARGLSFGSALVTTFAGSRCDWSLIFLPDDERSDPVELRGHVLRHDGSRVTLAYRLRDMFGQAPIGAGYLFTGSNGRTCPSGLWIGRAEVDLYRPGVLHVQVPRAAGTRRVEVLVAVDGAVEGQR